MRSKFQSPSLRGSGRFTLSCGWGQRRGGARFNPLHCGAVVASPFIAALALVASAAFQSPSLRGSGRFERDLVNALRKALVSIPFIAGQWSLPRRPSSKRCKPPRVSIPFIAGQWSLPSGEQRAPRRTSRFNPLHCGAVVASDAGIFAAAATLVFQSPSLRGSGRFAALALRQAARGHEFQSPSLRGSGRFLRSSNTATSAT